MTNSVFVAVVVAVFAFKKSLSPLSSIFISRRQRLVVFALWSTGVSWMKPRNNNVYAGFQSLTSGT